MPGASGAIAAHAASDAIPDGYTLFAPAISLFIALPGKAENLPLMLPRDFLPVASLIDQPMFICASAASGIKTLPDLIARAKQHPNQLSFAATGIGRITHLTGLLLQSRADIKLQVVPYTGGPATALTDVVGGRVPLIIEGYSGLAGAIQAHSLTVLAVASAHRLPNFPTCRRWRRRCRVSPPADGRALWRRSGRRRRPSRRSTPACKRCSANRTSPIRSRSAAPLSVRCRRPKSTPSSTRSKRNGARCWRRSRPVSNRRLQRRPLPPSLPASLFAIEKSCRIKS